MSEPTKSKGRWVSFAVALLYLVAFVVVSVQTAQSRGLTVWWDFYNYEYGGGYAYLHGFGGVHSLIGQYQTYLTPQLNALYYYLEVSLGSRGQELWIAGLEANSIAVIAYVVFRAARFRNISTPVSVALGLVCGTAAFHNPLFRSELGGTMSDTLVVGVVFAGCAVVAKSFLVTSESASRRTLIFGSMVLGLAIVLKMTSAIYAASALLGLALALALNVRKMGVRTALRRWLLAFGAMAGTWLVLYLPQGLELWRKYRNPLFPYFNGVFHSPLQLPENLRDERFAVHNAGEWWQNVRGLIKGTDVLQSGNFTVRAPSVVIIVALIVLLLLENVVRRRDPFLLFVESTTVIAFGIWGSAIVLFRYGAPLLLCVGAIFVVSVIYRSKGRAVWVLVALAVTSSLALSASGGTSAKHDKSQKSHFTIDASVLAQSKTRVLFVGNGALGFIYPSLPPGSDVVRVGGDLERTMSDEYWQRTADYVNQRIGPWSLYVEEGELRDVPAWLAPLKVWGKLGACVPAASWRHHVVLHCDFAVTPPRTPAKTR